MSAGRYSGLGFEPSDARAKPLLIFAIGLVLLSLLTAWVSRYLTDKWTEELEQRSSTHPMEADREAPSAPLLQATTREEYKAHARAEDELLNGHGWIDTEQGILRIPIRQAMKIALERGFPVREGGGE